MYSAMTSFMFIASFTVIGTVLSSADEKPGRTAPQHVKIDGHISHGVNSFNSMPMVDFSSSSNIFNALGPVHEIGVYNPSGTNASKISESTPDSALMATIDAYDFRKGLGFPKGVGPFNVPIAKTPTIALTSLDINDRVEPRSFAESSDPAVLGTPYLSAGADKDVTLGEWNRISGRLSVKCFRNIAFARVVVKNALPNGVYTMWDVGVSDPLTDQEAPSAGPFGGLPNVIATDHRGYGYAYRRLRYCPLDKCKGSKRCTLYVSMFYHFDHMVYAGSPALDAGGPAIGNVASNQLQFFINAENIIPPQNKFRRH